MAEISRRTFFKFAATAGALAGAGSAVLWVNPDPALAESTSPETVKFSMCSECNHTPFCGLKVIVKDDKVYRIEKREKYQNNLVCAKGIASIQETYDPERLLHPMKRTNPKGEPAQWEQITWEEALKTIADKFNEIKQRDGAEKVLFITGDPKEPRPILQRLAYTFGSPNMGTESSLCYNATELATQTVYGARGPVARSIAVFSAPDPENTRTLLFWGANVAWSTPFGISGMRNLKKNAKDLKFICIDPRKTPTVRDLADVHIQSRPGTDGALALCFGNYLIEHDLYDKDFIGKWVHGFDEYKAYVKDFTIEKTAETCGVSADVITAACEAIGRGGNAGPLINRSSAQYPHHTNGVNTFRAIQMLVALTGSLDVPGGPHVADEPLPVDLFNGVKKFTRVEELLPGLDEKRVDRKYFPLWADIDPHGSVQLNMIPEYVRDGDIKACFAMGVNGIMWPQSHEYQEAFKNMEFMVSADFYYRPQTHDYVDMILPAAMHLERSCVWAVFGRKFFLREPAVKPLGEARADWRICCDLGTALGFEEEFFGGGEGAEAACLAQMAEDLGAFTYHDLVKAVPGPVEVPMKGAPQMRKYELGLLRSDGAPGFSTPSGKIEFYSDMLEEYGYDALPVHREPVHSPISTPDVAEDFPLIMNSGSRVPWFTHSKHRNIPWLRQFMPDPVVRLYPSDADARGIADGDEVVLSSPYGEMKVKAEITRLVKPGVIDVLHGWAEADVNELIGRDFDPISGFPPFKEGLCEVKKA